MIDYQGIARAIITNDWDDNNAIKYDKYSIIQFQGTAFDSDYKCYKVVWSDWVYQNGISIAQKSNYKMVAKETNNTEKMILRFLGKEEGVVPKILANVQVKFNRNIVFEEFVDGSELYLIQEHSSWIDTAINLAEIHKKMWETESETLRNINFSNDILERMQFAKMGTRHNREWSLFTDLAIARIDSAPRTLVHGDLFPTNVIINNDSTKFIDWADSCVFAYMVDISRLTAIIDIKTLRPMCPCEEKVLDKYFETLEPSIQIKYEDYLRDVRFAQYIELASIYIPPGCSIHNYEYNKKVEERLNEIIEANLCFM